MAIDPHLRWARQSPQVADDGEDALTFMSTNGPEVKTAHARTARRRAAARDLCNRFARWLMVLALVASQASSAAIPPRLKAGLSSSSVKVRVIAVAAIAKTKDPEATALVRPLLKDADGAVRAAAIDALRILKDVSLLPTIVAMKDDAVPAVRAVAARAEKALAAIGALEVDTGDVADLSGKANPALVASLQAQFEAELKTLSGGLDVKHGGVKKGYGALLRIRSISKAQDGGNEFMQIKCDMTLVELPGKVLRLSASANAGAGVEGAIPASMEADLIKDGIAACAPSLAKDFSEYIEQRRGR